MITNTMEVTGIEKKWSGNGDGFYVKLNRVDKETDCGFAYGSLTVSAANINQYPIGRKLNIRIDELTPPDGEAA